MHKKARELGFKLPPNAVLSTRTKRKTNPVFDDDCVFTLPQSVGGNTQDSMPSNKKGKLACYKTSSVYNTPTKQKGGNNILRNGSARLEYFVVDFFFKKRFFNQKFQNIYIV